MKAPKSHNFQFNKKLRGVCECREYIFVGNQLLCKICGKPMKSERKPLTTKGAKYKLD